MSTPVWVRPYAEQYGATVEWDDVTKEVLINGLRIKPDYIEEDHAYVSKEKVDAVLTQLGLMEDYRTSRGIVDIITRSPAYLWIQDKYEQLKSWVIEHIWSPVREWFDEFVSGLNWIVSSIVNLPLRIYGFIISLRNKFTDTIDFLRNYADSVSDWVYKELTRPLIDVIDFITSIKDKILHFTTNAWNKFIYITDEIFDQIKSFFDEPVGYVSELVIHGFSSWWQAVENLIENYIDEHWEDEV